MKRLLLYMCAASVAALMGCGGHGQGDLDIEVDPPDEKPPEVTVVFGAPSDGAEVGRVTLATTDAPLSLSVAHGRVVVGTSSGVFVQDEVDPALLVALPVVAIEGEPESTGGVRALARRAQGGVLVAAEQGLFHDAEDALHYSPLTQSLAGAPSFVHSLGEGDGEELWLIPHDVAADPRVVRVAASKASSVKLRSIEGAPVFAVATAPGVAVLAQAGALYEVDANAATAKLIADGLGAIHGADRGVDGAVWFATEAGLVVRAKDGAVSRYTLSAEGEPAQPVRAVSAAFGEVVVTTGDAVIRIAAQPVKVAARAAGASLGAPIALDATGDLWTVEDGALTRLLTGKPVSFATDVKPFFAAHCTSCHAVASSGAPQFDFEDFAVATAQAERIVIRLQAQNISPMPPQSAEVLTPAEYAVVLRWVAGGMQP